MSTESMTTTGAAVPQAAADGVTNPKGIGLFRMVTTVITLIVGARRVLAVGRCRRPAARAAAAILTAWGISAIGVFCLVMTFFALSRVKPDLKGGIYTYAATGFGDFLGFNSAWGYWICGPSVHGQLLGASVRRAVVLLPDLRQRHEPATPSSAPACIIWFYAFLVSAGHQRGDRHQRGHHHLEVRAPAHRHHRHHLHRQHFKPDIFIDEPHHRSRPVARRSSTRCRRP